MNLSKTTLVKIRTCRKALKARLMTPRSELSLASSWGCPAPKRDFARVGKTRRRPLARVAMTLAATPWDMTARLILRSGPLRRYGWLDEQHRQGPKDSGLRIAAAALPGAGRTGVRHLAEAADVLRLHPRTLRERALKRAMVTKGGWSFNPTRVAGVRRRSPLSDSR